MSDQLIQLLGEHNKILIFTGAGISTGSGIPDYRGPQGVWKRRQPVYYQDFMTSEAARIEYWDYKLEGWEGFRQARPNAAHEAIVQIEKADKLLMVVTQNIDGLHSAAGTSGNRLVELHGTNLAVECQDCWQRTPPDDHFAAFKQTGKAPLCEDCEGYLKPATISFGQNLRENDLRKALEAAEHCDMVIALGSTLSVNPAAQFPLLAARRGVPYVIINRGDTDHDGQAEVSLRLEGDVVEIFPTAVKRLLRRHKFSEINSRLWHLPIRIRRLSTFTEELCEQKFSLIKAMLKKSIWKILPPKPGFQNIISFGFSSKFTASLRTNTSCNDE